MTPTGERAAPRPRWGLVRLLPRRWRLPARRLLVWARHFYPYAWAHAPLCDRYGAETLRFGHVFVCRSCAAAAAGTAVSFAIAIATAATLTLLGGAVVASVAAAGAIVLSALHNGRVRSRLGRDLSRAGLGVCAGVTLAAPALVGWPGLVAWPALWVAAVIARRRVGVGAVDRCAGCPHVNGQRACPGFERQVRAVVRIQREL
ncbi:MAG: hypothetical protein CVU56_11670 [Deltaproteobacteria bacterium HGW-Deltaproteobacteria-14]|nr:MAG: hypothetical protein CVU56_11670 [Deltaproteobacteria bacterium HGW-Deltaproteobacteria-14]